MVLMIFQTDVSCSSHPQSIVAGTDTDGQSCNCKSRYALILHKFKDYVIESNRLQKGKIIRAAAFKVRPSDREFHCTISRLSIFIIQSGASLKIQKKTSLSSSSKIGGEKQLFQAKKVFIVGSKLNRDRVSFFFQDRRGLVSPTICNRVMLKQLWWPSLTDDLLIERVACTKEVIPISQHMSARHNEWMAGFVEDHCKVQN